MPLGLALEEKPYADRIFDMGIALSEEELEGYVADLKATLARPHLSSPYRAYLFNVMATAFQRLERWQDGLRAFEAGYQSMPTAMMLGNLGTAYLQAGQKEKGLDCLARAADMPDGRTVSILGNLADAFWQNGAPQEAQATLQETIGVADPTSVKDMFALAVYAAEQHLHAEAVEFLARSLALRHGIDLGEERAIDFVLRYAGAETAVTEALEDAIQHVAAFENALTAPHEGMDEAGDHEAVMAVFEETRPMRERANETILMSKP